MGIAILAGEAGNDTALVILIELTVKTGLQDDGVDVLVEITGC